MADIGVRTAAPAAAAMTSLPRPRGWSRRGWLFARRIALATLGTGALVAIWWAISTTTISARVPSPMQVVEAIVNDFVSIRALQYTLMISGGIYQNLLYTFGNVAFGVSIGCAIGLVLGVAIGRSRIVHDLVMPPMVFLGTIPVVMLLPFLSMWFGISTIAQNGLVIFYTALTVTVVAQNATGNVAGRFEQYAASLGAGRPRMLFRVILPAILPEVIGAVRVCLAAGWGLEALAEILGAPAGAGRLIQGFSVAVMTPNLIGVLVCVGVLAVIVDGIVAAAGRWIVRWQE